MVAATSNKIHPVVESLSEGPILLYDGECGVCAASVQWILKHERSMQLRFASLQSPAGRALREAGGVGQEIDSLIWVEAPDRAGGAIRVRIWSDAVLSVLNYVGGVWKILLVMRWVPAILRHAAYRLFAKHRLMFVPVACLLPPPGVRRRFLEG